MENKPRGKVIFIFLPIALLYLIQTGVSFFMYQISLAVLAKSRAPVAVSELLKELIEINQHEAFFMGYTLISSLIAGIAFFVWYRFVVREDTGNLVELDLSKPSYPAILLGVVLVAAGGQYVMTFLAELIIKLMPTWLIAYEGVLDSMGLSSTGPSALSIPLMLYVVFAAPVMEELLFRGLCLRYSLRCFGTNVAVIISALLFAMMHGNPLQGIVTFLFALVLGYIVAKTGKIWVAVFIHIGFNAISYFVPQLIVLTQNPIKDFVILFTSLVAVYLGMGCILRGQSKN